MVVRIDKTVSDRQSAEIDSDVARLQVAIAVVDALAKVRDVMPRI